MGRRLSVTAIALVVGLASAAQAADFVSCWVTKVDTGFGHSETVTRCRIAGSDTVDYGSDASVPSVLYPNLGTDLVGPCWYLTSVPTMYIIITRYADGTADIGYDPDPSIPGEIIVVGPTMARCTSEPTPAADPAADAWDYVI